MLVGDLSLKWSKISLKVMIQMLRRKGEGILAEINGIESWLKETLIPATLFDTYSAIF